MTRLSYINVTANGERIPAKSWAEAKAIQSRYGGHYTATYEPIYPLKSVTAVIKNRPII